MLSEEKRIWGIHTKDDNLFLHQDVIAIGWKDNIDFDELKYLPYECVVTDKEPTKWLLEKSDFLITRTNGSKDLVENPYKWRIYAVYKGFSAEK